ncbi:hypothetical protein QP538_10420, partial [Rothia aeria]|nr:hypothetical protein [Rothia aeria]
VTADEVYALAQQATDQAPAGESEGAHRLCAAEAPVSVGFPDHRQGCGHDRANPRDRLVSSP